MKKNSLRKNESLDDSTNESYSDDELVVESLEENGGDIIKKLRKRLKDCTKEKQEYLDGWQRSKADFLNARKQDAKGMEESLLRGKESFVADILPVLDSFDMAFQDKAKDAAPEWNVGIGNIRTQLLGILKEYGVNEINPEGESFDPLRHDSIETVPTDNKAENNHVVEILQKGYEMNGRVLRAARVKVAHFK